MAKTHTFGLVALALSLVWWLASSGFVSSNDGSHVALARALAIRHETSIDPDVALTLFVDRSQREGHQYSDRPPGTAFAALPAVWIGDRLDGALLRRSLATHDVVLGPAAENFAHTYAARAQRLHVPAVPLLALQGTALLAVLQAIALGLLGLHAVDAILRRRAATPQGRAYVALGLGLGTLYGPYATALFSHVTTAAMLALGLDALERSLQIRDRPRTSAGWAIAAGLFGAWAIASDYLALLLVVPVFAVTIPWRTRPWTAAWLALGAVPITLATLAYHHAAFGSPFGIGYDHHANFAFARARASTFDGDPLSGLWILLGLGRGAGALALAPLTLVGLAGLVRTRDSRWLWAALPWVFAVSLHHTPWGGASEDHRYLVPLLPLLAVGLGHAWSAAATHPRAGVLKLALAGAAAVSAALVWPHVFAVRG